MTNENRPLAPHGEYILESLRAQVRGLSRATAMGHEELENAQHQVAALRRDLATANGRCDKLAEALEETTTSLDKERCEHAQEIERMREELLARPRVEP